MRLSIVPLFASLIIPQSISSNGSQELESQAIESRDERSRPNIIIVITDDQGYSDMGCYGGEIQTPALDRMASEGVRFTHFQNAAMCIASRASLMTGNYSVSAMPGFENMPVVTEYLQQAGYRNALI
jgi:arylsulfatase